MNKKLFRNKDLISKHSVVECFQNFQSSLHSDGFKQKIQEIFDEHNSKYSSVWPAPFTKQKQILSDEKFLLEATIDYSRTLEPYRLVIDLTAIGNNRIPLISMIYKFSKISDYETKIETYVEDTITGLINRDHLKVGLPIAISIASFMLHLVDVYVIDDQTIHDNFENDDQPDSTDNTSLSKKLIPITTILVGIVIFTIFLIPTESTPNWPACVIPHMKVLSEDEQRQHGINNLFLSSDLERNDLKMKMRMLSDDAHTNRNYEKSIAISSTVLKIIDPHDFTSLSQIGNAIRDTNKTNTSTLLCSKTIHEIPEIQEQVFGQMALAEDYLLLKEFQKSVDVINPVIEQCNNDSSFGVNSCSNSLIIRGNAQFRLSNYNESEKDYVQSIKLDGEKSDSLFGLANIFFHRDANFSEAAKYSKKAIIGDEDNTDIIQLYFRSLYNSGEHDKLKMEYNELKNKKPKIADEVKNRLPKQISGIL